VIRVNSQSGKGGIAYLLKTSLRTGTAAPAADRVQAVLSGLQRAKVALREERPLAAV
jgi:hypothetical protein